MSDLLILDWDEAEVRLLAGNAAGGKLRITQAESAPLSAEPTVESTADALRLLLGRYGGSKGHACVVVGGRDLQSRLLQVPPVPDDEMPDLVRLRASTEFPAADETATVDFLPILSGEGKPTTVLAARAAESRLARVRQIGEKLQLTVQHVTPRGTGIANLAVAIDPALQHGTHLLVACRGSELDLVTTHEGLPAVLRTVPMSGDGQAEVVAKAAAREIRRTIAAVGSELDTNDVDTVRWVSAGENDGKLAHLAGSELSRRIATLELKDIVSDAEALPTSGASFAGMLGALQSLSQRNLPIDFLAPRKPPEQKRPVTTYALAASLAALVLLGGGWMLYRSGAALQQAADIAIEEREAIEAGIEDLKPEVKQSQEVESWLATDVNWLDEMDRLAVTLRPMRLDNHDEYDPERDIRLTSFVAKQSPGRRGVGGSVEIVGQVRDSSLVQDLEDHLRGPGRQVNPKPLVNHPENEPYEWEFQDEIIVTPIEEDRR